MILCVAAMIWSVIVGILEWDLVHRKTETPMSVSVGFAIIGIAFLFLPITLIVAPFAIIGWRRNCKREEIRRELRKNSHANRFRMVNGGKGI